MKTKTIDEYCGQPEGSFRKFIQEQQAEEVRQEQERKERIRKRRTS
jgi:hypothetical protein